MRVKADICQDSIRVNRMRDVGGPGQGVSNGSWQKQSDTGNEMSVQPAGNIKSSQ